MYSMHCLNDSKTSGELLWTPGESHQSMAAITLTIIRACSEQMLSEMQKGKMTDTAERSEETAARVMWRTFILRGAKKSIPAILKIRQTGSNIQEHVKMC